MYVGNLVEVLRLKFYPPIILSGNNKKPCRWTGLSFKTADNCLMCAA
ncbi:hypothetical protein URS_3255 [Acinetobacter ursingii]|nr:hypothetical protein URS_3255 [Acinetobacter ursingii]